jgi:hypothetical protein
MTSFYKNSFAYTLFAGILLALGACQTETEYEYVTQNARYPYKEPEILPWLRPWPMKK